MINLKFNDNVLSDIDLIIFDKDGTFIDIHKYWGKVVELRSKAVIQYFGLDDNFFKPLCDVMGYDLTTKKLPPNSPVGLYARGKVQEILLYFLVSNGVEAALEDIERIFQEVGQEFIKIQEDYTTVISSAVELIKKLAQKKPDVRMVVVTSDSKDNAICTVKKQGLEKYFEKVYGAEDSDTAKTTGDIVKKVLEQTGITADRTVCIGDTYDDFLMAKNSGLKACINVSTGVVTTEQQKEFNNFCVKSLNEIEVI